MVKQVLGRGLGALLGGTPAGNKAASPFVAPAATASPGGAESREQVILVNLSRIHPCTFQPRKDFPPESIRELADSIKESGILQPLLVRAHGDGYELIAGERRWRAAQLVGLHQAPVIVRDADDRAVLEMALIENLQRENLNAMEEAQGYAQLIEQFHLKQEEASAKVGKSRSAVANALRLLQLAPEVQTYLRNGLLSVGHAKVILGMPTPTEQKLAAEKAIKDGLSVRQTEELVAAMQEQENKPASGATQSHASTSAVRDLHVVDIESRLQEHLGTRVLLRYRKGKGSVEIKFFTDDDLERVLGIVGLKMD